MTKVLIVEDDAAIAVGLSLNLNIEGYQCATVADGDGALDAVRAVKPDLILLDISLPKKNGLDVLAELRRGGNHTPVIVLSARQDEFDKVAALRLGADDYVTKPFALAELIARCGAVLRRTRGAMANGAAQNGNSVAAAAAIAPERFGDVTMDLVTRRVYRGADEVAMTHLELELLAYFVRNPAKVFSRDQLLRQVWGAQAGSPRTVDNFVGQLRAKLEADPESPRHFITVRGSGYRFDP